MAILASAMDLNPRNVREKLGPFVGKKVVVGTTDWHYISGKLEAIDGDKLVVTVQGKQVLVPATKVGTIREAPPLQAEYIK